jgi:hypothetical protein
MGELDSGTGTYGGSDEERRLLVAAKARARMD